MCIPCVTMPAPWVPTSMTVRTCRHQDCDHSMWLHNPSKTNRVELDADQYLCSCNNCQVVQDTWLEMCIAYRCAVSVTSDALCRRIASVNILRARLGFRHISQESSVAFDSMSPTSCKWSFARPGAESKDTVNAETALFCLVGDEKGAPVKVAEAMKAEGCSLAPFQCSMWLSGAACPHQHVLCVRPSHLGSWLVNSLWLVIALYFWYRLLAERHGVWFFYLG